METSSSAHHWTRKLIAAHARDNPVVMTVHKRSDPIAKWAAALRDRAGWQKAAVALANKNARMLWAVMTKGEAQADGALVLEAPAD